MEDDDAQLKVCDHRKLPPERHQWRGNTLYHQLDSGRWEPCHSTANEIRDAERAAWWRKLWKRDDLP